MPNPFDLWLPILAAAVVVFILSSIIHRILPWHKSDYPKLPNQEAVMDALRPLNIPPGEYMVPRPDTMADMKTPEFKAAMDRGPVFILNMFPNGMRGMGRPLGLWFIYLLIVDLIAGYVAQTAVVTTSDLHVVFHVAGLTSFLGFAGALWQMTIWYRRPAYTTFKSTVDGLIYAAVTAGIFVWLWPR
jgi:hypothetical protein